MPVAQLVLGPAAPLSVTTGSRPFGILPTPLLLLD